MRAQRRMVVIAFTSSLVFIIGTVESACSSSCSSCVNDKCERCLDGTYFDNSTQECLACPDKCTSCYNGDYCYNCTSGFYSRTCTIPCKLQYCIGDECDIDIGYCISGCREGYFQVLYYCFPCESNCKTCANSSNVCTRCKEGHYGYSCQYNCSYCKDGLCSKYSCTNGCGDRYYMGSESCYPCSIRCTSCSSFDNCHACQEGYWGHNCRYTCIDCSPCNKDNGSCAMEETTTSPRIPTSNTPPIDKFKTTRILQETSYPEMTTEASSTISDISGNTGIDDDNDLLYPAVIGWVLVVLLIGVVIVLVVFVYRRRVSINQEHNSRNVSPSDHVSTSQDYTSLNMTTRREDENQYSVLQNPGSMVTIATNSMNNTRLQDENTGETNPTSSQVNGTDGGIIYINT